MIGGSPWLWLWQALACVLAAMLVALLAPLLHRVLRLSHASHRFWLGAWALAVLPMPAALVLRWLAPVKLSVTLPLLRPIEVFAADAAAAVPAGASAGSVLSLGSVLVFAYAGGVLAGGIGWSMGLQRLRRLLRTVRPIASEQMPGPATRKQCRVLSAAGIRVLVAVAAPGPFALGWPCRRIVVPQALLQALGDEPLRLVLRHEAAHLRRNDPLWALLLRLGGLLLWFNPFLRPLARRAQLAAELACDAEALAADTHLRRTYARAYVEVLRLSIRSSSSGTVPSPGVAFSPHHQGSHRMRIDHIVHGDPNARRRPFVAAAVAAIALAAGGGLTAVQAAAASGPAVVFSGPILQGWISSAFGATSESADARHHNGIDLAAAHGTPVHAPAAGTVLVAEQRYQAAPSYGTVVVLDHGDGWQTLYAHLGSMEVEAGDQVASGDAIGRIGVSGKSTGPHVHVEVRHNGQRVDPASVIGTPVATR